MNLVRIRRAEERDLLLARLFKLVRGAFRGPVESHCLFVCGQQRSGTTMLMRALQIHPDTEVFHELPISPAFDRYCLRDLQTLDRLVAASRAPVVCFKPLMDSHRAPELLEHFRGSRVLWMLRRHTDVANSTIRKFEDPNVNLRRMMNGQDGAEGLRRETSETTLEILRTFDAEGLGEPDLACLRWWIRNRILLERNLVEHDRVRIQPYEPLVEGGRAMMEEIFRWVGLRPSARAVRHVHARSVGKNPAPDLDPEVDRLCRELHENLVEASARRNAPHTT